MELAERHANIFATACKFFCSKKARNSQNINRILCFIFNTLCKWLNFNVCKNT